MDDVTPSRRRCAVAVLGGPTTVIDIAGHRIVVDPTFDPPAPHGFLTKTAGPAVDVSALGAVDLVLISHDEHLDNLDHAGRALALSVPRVLTNPGAAQRLGPPADGMAPWQRIDLDGLRVQAVPAVHGPADGDRDASGNVKGEVTGFVLSGRGLPTIYVSGDNASLATVSAIARTVGAIDVAVLFVGALHRGHDRRHRRVRGRRHRTDPRPDAARPVGRPRAPTRRLGPSVRA